MSIEYEILWVLRIYTNCDNMRDMINIRDILQNELVILFYSYYIYIYIYIYIIKCNII